MYSLVEGILLFYVGIGVEIVWKVWYNIEKYIIACGMIIKEVI